MYITITAVCKTAKDHNGHTAVTEGGEKHFITEAKDVQWFTHEKPHFAPIGINRDSNTKVQKTKVA